VIAPEQQAQANVQVERQQPTVRFERTGEPRIVYQQAEGQPRIRFEPMNGASAQASAPAAPSDDAQRSARSGEASPVADQTVLGSAEAPPPVDRRSAQAQLNAAPGYGTEQAQGAPSDTTRQAPAASEPQQTGALPAGGLPVSVGRIEEMALYNARDEKLGEVEEVLIGPDNRVYVVVTHGGFLGLGEKRVAMPLEQVAMRGDRLVVEGLSGEQIEDMAAFDESQSGFTRMQGNAMAPVRTLQ
jgi:hypothetical protein